MGLTSNRTSQYSSASALSSGLATAEGYARPAPPLTGPGVGRRSASAWLRQITNANKLHLHRNLAARHDLADDDWVWIENGRGRVKAQVKLVTGVNENVVWTWNAIGKRKGAWGLDKDSPEMNRGFLLNHIITEKLLPDKGGREYSNSDPVTGQAAWYDLRVRLKKCSAEEALSTSSLFEPVIKRFIGNPAPLEYGADLQGADTGGKADLREYIGQRDANSQAIAGIRPGRGNRTRGDT